MTISIDTRTQQSYTENLPSNTNFNSLSNKSSVQASEICDEIEFNVNNKRKLRGRYIDEQNKRIKRNLVPLTNTAIIADRYRLSNTVVAAIGNAVLMDYNVLNSDTTEKIIDPNKVGRSRDIERVSAVKKQRENIPLLFGLYFDGRKDITLVNENGKRSVRKLDHISLINMPGSIYIGHITVDTGDSFTIAEEIFNYLGKQGIPMEDTSFVGCDGCNGNTGRQGGVIRLLEEKLNRPLQWFICLLHFIELPLKNLITNHDGRTTGPHSFTGPIGRKLENCEKLPVVKFQRIEFCCDVKNLAEISDTLSTDQKYLYDICIAISKGICPLNLISRHPGNISLSRWTTIANSLCRLYISTVRPTKLLLTLVKYVMWVYAPSHFAIKYQSSCLFGPIHLMNIIKTVRFLDAPYKKTVFDTIARNAFFAHPENVIIAVLNDENYDIRYRGWKKVLEIRNFSNDNKSPREFKVPPLNFDAHHYTEMVEWETSIKYLPPILCNFEFNSDDAKIYAEKRLWNHDFAFDLKKVPCHTQPVERCVKAVTEASKVVYGEQRRNGHIINTLQSRSTMSRFRTKKDFNLSKNSIHYPASV